MSTRADWINPIVVRDFYRLQNSRLLRLSIYVPFFGSLAWLAFCPSMLRNDWDYWGVAHTRTLKNTSVLYLTLLGMLLLVILPIQASFNLLREKQKGTLDVLIASGISPVRLVRGIWVNFMLRATLMVVLTSPLPLGLLYLGLQVEYANFDLIFYFWFMSAIVTGLALGFPPDVREGATGRTAVTLFGIVLFANAMGQTDGLLYSDSTMLSVGDFFVLLFVIPVLIPILIRTSSTNLFPITRESIAEKRSYLLAGMPFLFAAGLMPCSNRFLLPSICAMVYLPAIADAICERSRIVSEGNVQDDSSLFLPRWPCGFLFALVLTAGLIILFKVQGLAPHDSLPLLIMLGIGAIGFPVVFMRVLQIPIRVEQYLLLQLGILFIAIGLQSLQMTGVARALPLSVIVVRLLGEHTSPPFPGYAFTISILICVFVLGVLSPSRRKPETQLRRLAA